MEKLQKWLEEKCNEQNLSWREASLRMGLNAGFVSAVMGGQVPGLESCKAIANFFHVSPVLILQMAGHIENIPNSPMLDPLFQDIAACWPDLSGEDKRVLRHIAQRAATLRRRERGDEK
jgi:hypothetical protein